MNQVAEGSSNRRVLYLIRVLSLDYKNHTVCTDAEVSITKLRYFKLRERVLACTIEDKNEIITRAVAFGEFDGHAESLIRSSACASKSPLPSSH
jgi:hypothetical protein